MLSVFGGEYSKRFSRSRKKWDLDYRAGMSCAKKKGHTAILTEKKLEEKNILNNLIKMNMNIETISKITGLIKDKY